MAKDRETETASDMAGGDREARRKRRRARKAERAENPTAASPGPAPDRLDPADLLGDIDAWNLRAEGDWLRFDARLGDYPRGYMRPVAGGDIIADAPGPLTAILSLGGPRRAGFVAGPPQFSHHILAPADHIGSVGTEGTASATATPGLQRIPHRSRDALAADLFLSWRHRDRRGLPLMLVRAETDASASITDLGRGVAMVNFLTALDNLRAAAATLGRRARVLAVGIDFGAEDLVSDAAGFAAGFRALMTRITREMRVRDLPAPVFMANPEAGDHPATRAMWELAWGAGRHRLVIPAPGYMFARDRFGRLTENGLLDAAEMDAHALAAVESGGAWECPLPLLAEFDDSQIRVTFRATGPLVVDAGDPFGAGPAAGFALSGTDGPVTVQSATIAPDDDRVVILTCDHPPRGAAPMLHFALGQNGSAIRDGWVASRPTGPGLHRWALPAALPLRGTP